jgi:ribosomal-protein-alanine N-acetyltransferase
MILPEYDGKGIVSEAVKAMLNYAFITVGFHSVEAVIDPNNTASEKVLLKNGFRKEAHFVENFFWNNEFIDSVHYGLLKKEFKK